MCATLYAPFFCKTAPRCHVQRALSRQTTAAMRRCGINSIPTHCPMPARRQLAPRELPAMTAAPRAAPHAPAYCAAGATPAASRELPRDQGPPAAPAPPPAACRGIPAAAARTVRARRTGTPPCSMCAQHSVLIRRTGRQHLQSFTAKDEQLVTASHSLATRLNAKPTVTRSKKLFTAKEAAR